ncbi:hypothetical protein B7P43_G09800 [Cryptotermes secundus]|uniref:Endonuclease/exonuclease/phosphatase domain-containing protein n=1 Tax=Cryptotermes secundus TaxID=105785 RepID=A0A2J7PS43_9NEOP|nr:hypothetical protein B7P43_G09800 [Cryptotermes secundus]
MDMRFGMWNVRSIYGAGSLRAVADESSKYKLDLAGVQEVRWVRGGITAAGEYTFFYGKGNENHELEFVSDRISYIILKGRWCHIIVMNVRAPTEDKIDDIKDIFCEELEHVFDKFPKHPIKFLVNLTTSRNLTVKSTMFPHRNIHKFTWTSPNWKIHNQIDHILIDRKEHSSILDVQSFRAADCDTDHYLEAAKVRERLAVSKQTTHRVIRKGSIFKKLNEVEGKEQCRVEISNRFAALENLDTEVNVNKTSETIRENIKMSAKESLGYYELKKHKPWFDEEWSKL